MFGDHRGSQVMSLRLKPHFWVNQFSVLLRGYRPKIWRRIQTKDGLLLHLHTCILAAFGLEDEHTFRLSRCLPTYLNSDNRFQALPPETWLSQLVPLDGRWPISLLPKYVIEPTGRLTPGTRLRVARRGRRASRTTRPRMLKNRPCL
jgi:hypothetical protein